MTVTCTWEVGVGTWGRHYCRASKVNDGDRSLNEVSVHSAEISVKTFVSDQVRPDCKYTLWRVWSLCSICIHSVGFALSVLNNEYMLRPACSFAGCTGNCHNCAIHEKNVMPVCWGFGSITMFIVVVNLHLNTITTGRKPAKYTE